MAQYRFGNCELDTDRHELRVGGITRHVEPQVFDLLRLFAERGTCLVSRDDLIEHIWRGRVVSDSAISVRVNAARKAIGDDGRRQAVIRTVARRGFRMTANAWRSDDDGPSQEPLPLDSRPVLAVLPFETPGAPSGRGYRSRGIADDIATELSRFHALAVVSTFSSFQHRAGRDPYRFAAALGATHLVTGSLRTNGTADRLTIRLSDAGAGTSIWAEHYDIDRREWFEARDSVVFAIVGHLVSHLNQHRTSTVLRKPTSNLNAYDCVLRGLDRYKGGEVSRAEARGALFWFDRAVELDPHYARALAWRACAASSFWSNPPTAADLAGPTRDVELAVAVDPGDHEAQRLKGALHAIAGDHELADYHFSRSVELNPNDGNILMRIGYYKSFLGDRAHDLVYTDLALRRNPLHPPWYWHDRGIVLFAHRDYPASLECLRCSASQTETRHVYEGACHAALGDTAQAAASVRRLTALNPAVDVQWIERAYPYRCYRNPADLTALTSLLSRAGLR